MTNLTIAQGRLQGRLFAQGGRHGARGSSQRSEPEAQAGMGLRLNLHYLCYKETLK